MIGAHRAIAVAFLSTLALSACKPHEKAEESVDAAAASVPLAPPPEPSFRASRSPLVDESSRKLPTRLVRVNERTATVAITNKTDKPVARVEGWHYFYDAEKKCIDRGRHSCDVAIAPGATKECAVNASDIDFLPRAYKTIEVESHMASASDGSSVWQNENLVPPCTDRPLGGVSDEVLRARTGVKILTTFSGTVRDRPVFYAKNLGAKRTDLLDAVVYYYDKDGGLLRRFEALPKNVAIEPDHFAELEVGFARLDLPAGTQSYELVVWRVRYEDGSEWQNANLKSPRRKLGD